MLAAVCYEEWGINSTNSENGNMELSVRSVLKRLFREISFQNQVIPVSHNGSAYKIIGDQLNTNASVIPIILHQEFPCNGGAKILLRVY